MADISIPHLKALIERLNPLDESVLGGFYPKEEPLVTIEQFFKGSGGNATLWCNIDPPPELDEEAFWRSIRARDDVWDVLISLSQYDFNERPFEDLEDWVHADKVVVVTTASALEAREWFPSKVTPSEINPTELDAQDPVTLPSGMHPLCCWYD